MRESNTTSTRPNVLVIVLFVVYALLLVGLVLFKFPFKYQLDDGGRDLNLIPFAGSFADPKRGIGEVIENVLIFVPYGIYLSMLKNRWPVLRRILVIAATSVVFEAIQYLFAIGRSDVTDVLGNALGGVIGIVIYALATKVLRDRTNRILTIVEFIGTVFVVAFFVYLWLHSK